MPTYRRVVVVGASLAGLRAAEALRDLGHDGTLTVVGAEPHLPYDRPPLSKQLLTGRVGADDLALGAAAGLDVTWRLGTVATGLDLAGGIVTLEGGEELPFDGLVVATGSRPRTLAALAGRGGVHLLRTLEDGVALKAVLGAGPRLAVVGAGFIGLEVAASARALGLDVTVVEAAPVPLAAAIGAEMGALVADWHREHGVDLRLGTGVAGVIGDGRVGGLRLDDGSTVEADAVVVGVGASPDTGWLEGSGIDLDDGVRTDGRLAALSGGRPLPHVVAAGDVARWDHPAGGTWRLEHWTNAVEQGAAAATTLMHGAQAPVFDPVPYFWSDQHDRKLQMVGRALPGDRVAVVDGTVESRKLVAAYGRDGRLVAALGFSRPARVMGLKRSIADGAGFPPGVPAA